MCYIYFFNLRHFDSVVKKNVTGGSEYCEISNFAEGIKQNFKFDFWKIRF